MRAITVKQPWASGIVRWGKDPENRGKAHPWTSAVGERLALHAGQSWDEDAESDPRVCVAHGRHLGCDGPVIPAPNPDLFPMGAVIATVRLAGVHPGGPGCRCHKGWHEPDQFHLVLRDVVHLPQPVPARGHLGLWTLPDQVLADVLEQLAVTP